MDNAPHDSPADPTTAGGPLPAIETSATESQIRERLAVASRRGRLAGFDPRPADGSLFGAAAHGHPFDSVLLGRLENGRLTFRLRVLRRLPAIFAAILAFTIWPGVWFMDELMVQLGLWNGEHPWLTYYWYLPITVLPIPWMWKSAMARSRRSADEHGRETIAAIAKELNGSIR